MRRQPQRIDTYHRIGDHLKQILTAAAILLQCFNHVDALLQNGFLAFEPIDILLDLLQAGLLGLQLLDSSIGVFQLPLLREVDYAENYAGNGHRRHSEHNLHGRFQRYALVSPP